MYFPPRFSRNRGCFVVGVVVERQWVSVRQRQILYMPSPQGLLGRNYKYSNPNFKLPRKTCWTPQQMQQNLITTMGSARRKRQQHLSTSHSLALVSSSRGCGHATPPLPCRVASLDCSTLRRRNIANIRSEYKYTQEFLRQHPQ